jgi:hypothetical protein
MVRREQHSLSLVSSGTLRARVLGPLGVESLLILDPLVITFYGRDSTPGGYIPTLETKQRECWKLRDSRLRSQILIREYTVNLPTLPSTHQG